MIRIVADRFCDIAHAIREHRDRFPAIVVMPQARKGQHWNTDLMQKQALKALDASVKEFHGDRTRLYLTGMSMGGFGVWDMAGKHPPIFSRPMSRSAVVFTDHQIFPEARVALAADPTIADPYAETAREQDIRLCGSFMVATTRRYRWKSRGRWLSR